MQERLSRWGIGPRIAAAALTYAAIAGVATRGWPDVCRMRFLPDPAFVAAGSLLTLLGVVMLAVAALSPRPITESRLVASGIFALVRHPIYSAWIVLIVPGLGYQPLLAGAADRARGLRRLQASHPSRG